MLLSSRLAAGLKEHSSNVSGVVIQVELRHWASRRGVRMPGCSGRTIAGYGFSAARLAPAAEHVFVSRRRRLQLERRAGPGLFVFMGAAMALPTGSGQAQRYRAASAATPPELQGRPTEYPDRPAWAVPKWIELGASTGLVAIRFFRQEIKGTTRSFSVKSASSIPLSKRPVMVISWCDHVIAGSPWVDGEVVGQAFQGRFTGHGCRVPHRYDLDCG